jgi:hypothetical protein
MSGLREQTLPSWALAQALLDTLEDIQEAFSSPQPHRLSTANFTSEFGIVGVRLGLVSHSRGQVRKDHEVSICCS